MAKNQKTLENQYHMVEARCKDLEEQMRIRQKQWDQREVESKTTEKLMRELCEDILAKDSKEMVLGTDYSWSSIQINELIRKSKQSFTNYIASRTDFMQKLVDQLEERRLEIEGLKDQISVMQLSPVQASLSETELEEKARQERERKKQMSDRPMQFPEKSNYADNGPQIVMEETDFCDPVEERVMGKIAEKGAKLQINPKATPVTESRKVIEQKKARKTRSMKHMIDLKDYEKKMDELSWMILDAIGTKGHSTYLDIEADITEKDATYTQGKIRSTITILSSLGVINKEVVKTPKGALNVHQLSTVGTRLYQEKYGQSAVMSEMDQIMAEHDNCTHGYGIKIVAEMLRESGFYKSVSDRNRKNPIKIKEGISYIPDIICIDNNDVKSYYEYECVNHTQTNFNGKCNKMCSVTSVLNFIVPNRTCADKIRGEIGKWIENRGEGSLKNVTIRINTVSQLGEKNLQENKNWKYVFEPGKKGKEPYVNF